MIAAEEARQALRRHIIDRATNARLRYGLYIDAEVILAMLRDPEITRYPTSITFDAHPLEPGEFACVLPRGDDPADGYQIVLHPHVHDQPHLWPLLIAYYIADINYGEAVTAAEAELFGGTLLGLDVETYYRALCEIADSLPVPEDGAATGPTDQLPACGCDAACGMNCGGSGSAAGRS